MGAIRLFLALAVLQSHITAHFLIPANLSINNALTLGVNGGYAVMSFFVVSGFLISFVLDEKYDRPGGTAAFYRARALRIYPLWWCLYLIVPFITEPGLWRFIASRHVYDLVTGFFIFGSDWLLSFKAYPQHYVIPMPHGLELGWTLGTEMSFYLIAPFVLRSRPWTWALLAGSVLLRVLLNIEFPTETATTLWISWCYYFFPSLLCFFLLGHLSRQLYKKTPVPTRGAWLGLGFAALVLLIQDARYQYENVDFYAAILVFALCLPAIFAATKDNKIANFLGDLTYPLYLSHGVMIAVIETDFPAVQQAINYFSNVVPGHRPVFIYAKAAMISLAFWIVALLLATAVHFVIEKPAVRGLRWVFAAYDAARRRAAPDAVAP